MGSVLSAARGELRAALLAALEQGPATAIELRRRLDKDRPLDALNHALASMLTRGLVTRTGARGGGASSGYEWALRINDPAPAPVPFAPSTPSMSRTAVVRRDEPLAGTVKFRVRRSELAALDERASDRGITRSELVRDLIAGAMGWPR